MPSSTSSSSERIPSAPYGRQWLLALLLFVAMLVAGESYWRRKGFVPEVADTVDYWCLKRRRPQVHGGTNALVVVGASRAHSGLVPEELAQGFPGLVVTHLAISGFWPNAVVRDLCLDENFAGTIVVSTTTQWLLASPEVSYPATEYVDSYHAQFESARFVDRQLNVAIAGWLQSKLATLGPTLKLSNLASTEFQPVVPYVTMYLNRYRPLRYHTGLSATALEEYRQERAAAIGREGWTATGARFEQGVAELTELYRKLVARGGKMVLVRMPTTREYWMYDQRRAPKAEYWDRVEDLSGIPAIHFADYPELSCFDCPDNSHLDASDAAEFTRRLVPILKSKLGEGHGTTARQVSLVGSN